MFGFRKKKKNLVSVVTFHPKYVKVGEYYVMLLFGEVDFYSKDGE